MTEWWQEGGDDLPAGVPRRDYVPPTALSDPRTTLPNPEVTKFVPKGHGRRIATAWIVTCVAVANVGWAALDLWRWTVSSDIEVRALGLWVFCGLVVRAALSAGLLWYVWRWARQGDPRDRVNMGWSP